MQLHVATGQPQLVSGYGILTRHYIHRTRPTTLTVTQPPFCIFRRGS